MKQINLLPSLERKDLRLHFYAEQLIVFWAALIGSVLVFFLLALGSRLYLNRVISDTQKEIDQNKTLLDSSSYKDLQTQIILLNRNIKEIKNLQEKHYFWSDALVQLTDLIPSDMQLTQITFNKANGQIDIAGQAKDRTQVIQLWADIIKSVYFQKINFPLANLEKPKDANFTFTFFVVPTKFQNK